MEASFQHSLRGWVRWRVGKGVLHVGDVLLSFRSLFENIGHDHCCVLKINH
jgi:hypothetical protein